MSLAEEILRKAGAGFSLKQQIYFACLAVPDNWPKGDSSEEKLLALLRPKINQVVDQIHRAEVANGVSLPLAGVALEVYGLEGKIEVDANLLVFPVDPANRTTMHELSSSASGAASAAVRWYLTTHSQPNGALYIECSRNEFRQHIYQAVQDRWNEMLGRYLKTKALSESAPANVLAQYYLNQLHTAIDYVSQF